MPNWQMMQTQISLSASTAIIARDDASVQGLECYYSKDSTEGQVLAETIADQMDATDQTVSRGARTAGYRVLLRTKMPAVLIELGYFSNSSECGKLASSEYQSLLAENIAEAVMNRMGEI